MPSTQDLVTVAGGNHTTTQQSPNYSAEWLRMLAASGVPNDIANAAAYNNFGQEALPAISQNGGGLNFQGGTPSGGVRQSAPTGQIAAAAAPGLGVGVPVTSAGVPAATGAPDLNLGYGSDFVNPILQLLGQIYGIGENARQFDVTSAFSKAQQLAQLNANPLSAFEAAALRAQLGMGGGGVNDIRSLIAPQTGGAGIRTMVNPNGGSTLGPAAEQVRALLNGARPSDAPGSGGTILPNTLSGADLTKLAGNPLASGVLQSYATAAGNPDILKRSVAALLSSGFGGSGSGL